MYKISMVSLGCPKNQLDTEVMLGHIANAGYEITPEETEADIVVINTCAFIEEAKKEEKKEPRQESRTTTPKRKRHGKRSKKNKLPLHWLKKTLQKLNPVTRDLSSTGTGIIEIFGAFRIHRYAVLL